MTDAEAAAAIAARLEPGESLLWSQAAPGGALAEEAAPLLAFTIVWNVFVWAAAWIAIRDRSVKEGLRDSPTPVVVLVIFVLVGLFLLYGTATTFGSAWSTSYGLTDRRVIIAREAPFRATHSYGPAAFARMEVREGDIWFDYGDSGKHGPRNRERLRSVPEPEALAARIRAALAPEAEHEAEPAP